MSDDAFWALVNVAALLVPLPAYGVVLWLNARAVRRQADHRPET